MTSNSLAEPPVESIKKIQFYSKNRADDCIEIIIPEVRNHNFTIVLSNS